MSRAVALANNDIAFVAWSYDAPIKDCLGFSLHRTDLQTSQTTVLPAWVGFRGGSNPNWQAKTTDEWPVQKFNWRDFTAKPRGSYRYQVIPMIGQPDSLTPLTAQALTTNLVELTPKCGRSWPTSTVEFSRPNQSPTCCPSATLAFRAQQICCNTFRSRAMVCASDSPARC